jgi:hypothetical protein
MGKKIYEKAFTSSPLFNESIHLDSLQAGVYFVTVIDSFTTTIKKIIKY